MQAPTGFAALVALNRTSKIVLTLSTFLTAYALQLVVALAVIQHDHHHHHAHQGGPNGGMPPRGDGGEPLPHGGHRHGGGPCALGMLAWSALIAGVTGMFSGFKPRSCRIMTHIIALFILEVMAILYLFSSEIRGLRMCKQMSTHRTVEIDVAAVQIGDSSMIVAQAQPGAPVFDAQEDSNCRHHVVHHVVILCAVVGLLIGVFLGAASRLLRQSREAAAALGLAPPQTQPQVVVACIIAGAATSSMESKEVCTPAPATDDEAAQIVVAA